VRKGKDKETTRRKTFSERRARHPRKGQYAKDKSEGMFTVREKVKLLGSYGESVVPKSWSKEKELFAEKRKSSIVGLSPDQKSIGGLSGLEGSGPNEHLSSGAGGTTSRGKNEGSENNPSPGTKTFERLKFIKPWKSCEQKGHLKRWYKSWKGVGSS